MPSSTLSVVLVTNTVQHSKDSGPKSPTGSKVTQVYGPFPLQAIIWQPLPAIILGAIAVTAGLCNLLLPETLNKKLPETLEDGENFGT
jgi:hypothetical protein